MVNKKHITPIIFKFYNNEKIICIIYIKNKKNEIN